MIDLNALLTEFLETQRSIATSLELISERLQATPAVAPAAPAKRSSKSKKADAAEEVAAPVVAAPVVAAPVVAAPVVAAPVVAAPVVAAPVVAAPAPANSDVPSGYEALDATSQFTAMLALVRPHMNNPHVHAEVVAGLTRVGLTPPVGRPENPDLPGDGYLNLANAQRVELMQAFTAAVRLVQQAAGG